MKKKIKGYFLPTQSYLHAIPYIWLFGFPIYIDTAKPLYTVHVAVHLQPIKKRHSDVVLSLVQGSTQHG